MTLTPGIYSSVSSFDLTGVLTLDAQGDSNAVFIIKSNSHLVTAASSVVVLTNQAQAKNVFWAPQGYFTAGADSIFKGNVLATSYVSIGAGAVTEGRLFSQTSYVVFGSGSADSVFGITGIGTPNIGATGAALTPTFETPTPTSDGFTVQISNYSNSYTWAGTATVGGTVVISGTGLVTVSGVAANTESTATITTTRVGYTGGTASVSATSLPAAAVKTIEFTDVTLVDGTKGQVYSDLVAARTLLNGVADGKTVAYSVSPSFADLGLSMDSAGVVSGTVSASVAVGTYSFKVTATSAGYVTETYVYSLVIKAAVVPDTKTIEFTDVTLVDGTKGQVYSDLVAARTLLNGVADGKTVAYSVSPSFADLGLSMDSAGVVSGTVSTSVAVGTYSFTVTATSPGYVTETYVYSLVIKAVVVPPIAIYKTIKFSVHFAPGSSKLTRYQQGRLLKFVKNVAPKVIDGSVYGFVQRTHCTRNDMALSISRARVVAKFLYSHGVKASLQVKGKGVLNSNAASRTASITLRYKK